LGMEATDGTGITLAWPLVRAAAALLTEVSEGDDPGPSLPAELDEASAPQALELSAADSEPAESRLPPLPPLGDEPDRA
jgi:hypothetical protein